MLWLPWRSSILGQPGAKFMGFWALFQLPEMFWRYWAKLEALHDFWELLILVLLLHFHRRIQSLEHVVAYFAGELEGISRRRSRRTHGKVPDVPV